MAGLPTADDLLAPMAECLADNFMFPELGDPGMPALMKPVIDAALGPVATLADLMTIPTSPADIKEFLEKLNTLATDLPSLLIAPFKLSAESSGLPAITFNVFGLDVSAGKKLEPPEGMDPANFDADLVFDPQTLIDMIIAMITVPFTIITEIITSLLELSLPPAPTLDGITEIVKGAFEAAGLSADPIAKFIKCFVKAILEIFSAIFPV